MALLKPSNGKVTSTATGGTVRRLTVTAFATAARNAGATLSVAVTGLSNALKGLIKILQGLTDSLGLQGLDGILSNLGGLFGGLFS